MKVCPNCFNDSELKSYIETISTENGKCDYCNLGTDSVLLGIVELKDFFAEFLGIFKEDSDGERLVEIINNDWNLFSVNVTDNKLLSDLLSAIDSSISDPFQKVKYIDDITYCTSYWEKLKFNLKWNRRYLTDLEELFEIGWGSFFNEECTLSYDQELYRARIHKNADQHTFPLDKMKCPRKEEATSGRANPQGIPYLYLSKNPETTLYETRATHLDEISVGKFKIKENEEVVLVDFTEEISAYNNIGNILEYTKSILLKKDISIELSKPIRRYDSELEYIPTQFICEFIRYNSKANFKADGILFNSSLHLGGKNIVLFEQDKVECISVEKYRITNIDIKSSIV
ncbi:MAG: RES family NAD+ phosphorylase [Candidatus Cloacimonetes bacterium]|nr:RES family NAD+ phosphorylase [Candidatus Cloacimonadota bacterium]